MDIHYWICVLRENGSRRAAREGLDSLALCHRRFHGLAELLERFLLRCVPLEIRRVSLARLESNGTKSQCLKVV